MDFFVNRPVFATVIALFISLLGLLSVNQLAVEQYPNVAPPQVKVTAVYSGASPEILETTLAAPLEREMNGIEGLLDMQSSSTANGLMELTLSFEPGTDLDIAAVEVNNAVKRVEPLLPQSVVQAGVRVAKTNAAILAIITLQSDDARFDATYLSNLANYRFINELKRLPGAGDVSLFGYPYAMRLWVNADSLAKYGLTVSEVMAGVREQNQNYAVGEVGQAPNASGQLLTFPLLTSPGLVSVEQFGNIILRANPDGSVVHVRDVARVELGSEDYTTSVRHNGKPAAGVAVYLRPGANALKLAEAVRQRVDELSADLPSGVRAAIPYDTTRFVSASIDLVKHTFIEAFVLVLVVVYVFLGSVRATIVPMIAIPVSIIGTLAGMLLMGFSINMLTLFGMVLAIGIVVDDAIVVVEAVEHLMHAEGLSPREAARKAMRSIGGAIVGVTSVICAVFVPIAFLGGVTGTLYKQFAITITISTLLSAIVALTLTPALCALFLKSGMHKPRAIQAFDRMVEAVTARFGKAVAFILQRGLRFMLIYAVMIGGMVLLLQTIPGGFVPEEDKGSAMVAVDLPAGASPERTLEIVQRVEQHFMKNEPSVSEIIAINGFSVFYRYSNQAFFFMGLKDWEERKDPDQHALAIINRANRALYVIPEAQVFAINEPPISGMGMISGFDYRLIATDGDREKLNQAAAQLVKAAPAEAAIGSVRSVAAPDVQVLYMDVDRNKAKAMGVDLADLYSSVGALMGSSFINQFTDFGTSLKVKLSGDERLRADPEHLKSLNLRNKQGKLVPLSSVASFEWRSAPIALSRYNGYPSVQLSGTTAPGRSSGEAISAMEKLSADLPQGVSFVWAGQSLQEKLSGGQQGFVFLLSLIFVFLFLSALYESFKLPVAVFLVVPIGILGALIALFLRGTANDVFFQVGLITLIGLTGKNGILIVEFAKQRWEEGLSTREAAIEAAKLRLRPIVMTSLAFILGVIPLVIASGAGAATQHSVGTGILGGMLCATVIGVFFTPLFFYYMNRSRDARREQAVSKGGEA